MQALVLILFGLLTAGTRAPALDAQILHRFSVLRSIPVAANPHGIAFSRDGKQIFVVSSAGQALTV